ncbi:cell wall metabolism sensor histidine kinase WalK [Microbispora sp. H10830]|uniref:sensor histidine kinase n=1 Tax=Microbispora sp. H10830 TaxID=2729109 RepID=UPI001600B52A|nr:HAMP domain-containing sensor histidine kinase [Microbispora sp. H10830]
MTLRARLLLVLVVLAAAALTATGAAVALALRAYLVGRVDEQLLAAAATARTNPLLRESTDRTGLLRAAVAPTDYAVRIWRHDGSVLGAWGGRAGAALLDRAPSPAAGGVSGPVTLGSGTGAYRVVSFVGAGGQTRAAVGLPLRPVEETVGRLLLIETMAGAASLGVLALVAHRLVARGLRPLAAIAATAGAIAGGDLDRRAPVASPRTEAGRLALAVNGMLARIQAAMEARARSEDRLRRFVADASHELRTPLTAVRGYLQMLRYGVVSQADRPDAVRRADDEAARMAKIVDDLLYLARLDQEPRLRRRPVDLATVAADAICDARAVAPDRVVALEAGDAVEVAADEDAVRQVLANLLGNVRTHTPPGTSATVAVRAGPGGGGVIEVRDAGPGMAPEVAERAFSRFYRGSSRPGVPGSGLGLSIVAAIARAHGGEATLDSGPGEGTVVRVSFPSPARSGRRG